MPGLVASAQSAEQQRGVHKQQGIVMEIQDIYVDMKVWYVPDHAQGNIRHTDVERGIVTSKNTENVFVRFGGDTHSKACSPKNLQ